MTKDQQIKKLEGTIKEMEAIHKESKDRLLELYEEERNKAAVHKFMYEAQIRALKSINALFLRNKKMTDFENIESELNNEFRRIV